MRSHQLSRNSKIRSISRGPTWESKRRGVPVDGVRYDLVVDTSTTPTEGCARPVLTHLRDS